MSERYATLITNDDGEEVVSSIAQMEGAPPEIRASQAKAVRVQKVHDNVKVGMIKGGPVDKAGGFGFREGTTPTVAPTTEPPRNTADEKIRPDVSKK